MIVYTPPVAAKKIPVIDFVGANVPWQIHWLLSAAKRSPTRSSLRNP
jgi:hypothetical protein